MHADSTGKPLSKLFLWMKKTINVRQNLTWYRSLWPAAYKNDGTKQFSPSYLVWNIGNIYFEDCKVPAEHFLKKKNPLMNFNSFDLHSRPLIWAPSSQPTSFKTNFSHKWNISSFSRWFSRFCWLYGVFNFCLYYAVSDTPLCCYTKISMLHTVFHFSILLHIIIQSS